MWGAQDNPADLHLFTHHIFKMALIRLVISDVNIPDNFMVCVINITNKIGWGLGYKRDDKQQDNDGAGRPDVDGFVGIWECNVYNVCDV
jgi:hypothetical protein